MTVRLQADGTIALEGVCPIEDAEALLQHLMSLPQATVDWRLCESAHTAIVQVLIFSRAEVSGPPRGEFLRNWVAPLLSSVGR
jgi:hypothetical protein